MANISFHKPGKGNITCCSTPLRIGQGGKQGISYSGLCPNCKKEAGKAGYEDIPSSFPALDSPTAEERTRNAQIKNGTGNGHVSVQGVTVQRGACGCSCPDCVKGNCPEKVSNLTVQKGLCAMCDKTGTPCAKCKAKGIHLDSNAPAFDYSYWRSNGTDELTARALGVSSAPSVKGKLSLHAAKYLQANRPDLFSVLSAASDYDHKGIAIDPGFIAQCTEAVPEYVDIEGKAETERRMRAAVEREERTEGTEGIPPAPDLSRLLSHPNARHGGTIPADLRMDAYRSSAARHGVDLSDWEIKR